MNAKFYMLYLLIAILFCPSCVFTEQAKGMQIHGLVGERFETAASEGSVYIYFSTWNLLKKVGIENHRVEASYSLIPSPATLTSKGVLLYGKTDKATDRFNVFSIDISGKKPLKKLLISTPDKGGDIYFCADFTKVNKHYIAFEKYNPDNWPQNVLLVNSKGENVLLKPEFKYRSPGGCFPSGCIRCCFFTDSEVIVCYYIYDNYIGEVETPTEKAAFAIFDMNTMKQKEEIVLPYKLPRLYLPRKSLYVLNGSKSYIVFRCRDKDKGGLGSVVFYRRSDKKHFTLNIFALNEGVCLAGDALFLYGYEGVSQTFNLVGLEKVFRIFDLRNDPSKSKAIAVKDVCLISSVPFKGCAICLDISDKSIVLIDATGKKKPIMKPLGSKIYHALPLDDRIIISTRNGVYLSHPIK